MSKDIIELVSSRGYDAFIRDDEIIVLNDGFISKSSLSGVYELMVPQKLSIPDGEDIVAPGIGLDEVVDLIISNHNTSKDINNGAYINMESMTEEEVINFFNDSLGELDQNKDG